MPCKMLDELHVDVDRISLQKKRPKTPKPQKMEKPCPQKKTLTTSCRTCAFHGPKMPETNIQRTLRFQACLRISGKLENGASA